mgnify:CR=1 FL=1
MINEPIELSQAPLQLAGPWTREARERAVADEVKQAYIEYFRKAVKIRNWIPWDDLPLKEMAAKLDVGFSVYTKWEYGLHVPPVEKLIQLAEILQTTVDYLLTGNRTEGRPLHNTRLLERLHDIQHAVTCACSQIHGQTLGPLL